MQRSAGARAQGARRERPRPDPQASERRRHVAQKISATRATAVDAERSSGVGAQPMAASFAERINALHGQAGQILHRFSLSGRAARPSRGATFCGCTPGIGRAPWRPIARRARQQSSFPGFRVAGTEWGRAGTELLMARILPVSRLWCQEKFLQDIVVRLQHRKS